MLARSTKKVAGVASSLAGLAALIAVAREAGLKIPGADSKNGVVIARIVLAVTTLERVARLWAAYSAARAVPKRITVAKTAPAVHRALSDMERRLAADDATYAALGETMFACLTPSGNPDDDMVAAHGGSRAKAYVEAADRVRRLGKEGLVTVDDLRQSTSGKLFWIHRILAPKVPGGIGVRVTVQLNLFSGTVANLGDEAQREQLRGILSRGELGCFALTEARAGVLSGLVVDTTATFLPGGGFEIHTPTAAGRKVWISQGLTAEWAVVIARLILPAGVDKGPHAFLVDLREGAAASTITLEDMAEKTAFNELDNAEITFAKHRVAHSALLCGISSVDAATGAYVLANPKQPFKFEIVAQRLLSGRICIPYAALSLVEKTHRAIAAYDREVPSGRDTSTRLCELPALADLLRDVDDVRRVLTLYVEGLQHEFMSSPAAVPARLVDEIAAAKILVLDFAIRATLEMKGRVGAFALFGNSPFGARTDLLYVFRFAEGDSNILMQKVARDALQSVLSRPAGLVGLAAQASGMSGSALEQRHARQMLQLAVRMAGATGGAKVTRWMASHDLVRDVATGHALLTIRRSIAAKDASLASASREMRAFDRFFAARSS